VLAVSIGVTAVFGRGPFHFLFRQAPRFAEHLGRALPPLDDAAALKRTLEQFHEELGMDAIVIDPRGTPLASAGTPIPVPDPEVLASAHRGASWMPRPPLWVRRCARAAALRCKPS